jgi:hypothetical protein
VHLQRARVILIYFQDVVLDADSKNMKRVTYLCLIVCLGWAVAARAEIVAELDRNPITEQETVTLILRLSQQSQGSSPDVTPLRHDFDVLSQNHSSQVSIINGQGNVTNEWRIVLFPKRAGELEVPPIQVGGEESQALSLTVKTVSGEASADEALFLSAEISADSVYVQAQLIYTLRLYTRIQVRPQDFSELQLPGMAVTKLGEDKLYETLRGEQRYTVLERRYAIFPESSGELEIPAQTFTGLLSDNRRRSPLNDPFFGNSVFDDLFTRNQGKTVRVRSQPLTVQVKPKPAEFPGTHWIAAKNLQIRESWQPDPPEFQVGAPVTRTLSIEGRGLESTLLPQLALPEISGLQHYPDRPHSETSHNNEDIIGRRVEKYALVAAQSGTFTLPEIRIPWWDTTSDSLRYALVPARTIHVSAAPVSAVVPASVAVSAGESSVALTAPSPKTGSFWPWLSAALALGWLFTALGLRHRRLAPIPLSASPSPDLAQARKQFNQACLAQDPHAATSALLTWARARWPGRLINNMGALAAYLEDEAAASALRALDQALYAPGAHGWDAAYCRCVVDAALGRSHHQRPAAVPALPRLYPQTLHS